MTGLQDATRAVTSPSPVSPPRVMWIFPTTVSGYLSPKIQLSQTIATLHLLDQLSDRAELSHRVQQIADELDERTRMRKLGLHQELLHLLRLVDGRVATHALHPQSLKHCDGSELIGYLQLGELHKLQVVQLALLRQHGKVLEDWLRLSWLSRNLLETSNGGSKKIGNML